MLGVPFRHGSLIWGIVPLYVSLLIGELTPAKADFRTALQTGFTFLWAGAQWLYPYFQPRAPWRQLEANAFTPINLFVTFLVLALGLLALVAGIRRRFPKHWKFLGRTRFSSYFMIAIYPVQEHCLSWTWDRLAAIALFAVPVWLLLHFGLMPLRSQR